jgi:hypothetical protein
LLSKGFRATSPLRFALTRQKGAPEVWILRKIHPLSNKAYKAKDESEDECERELKMSGSDELSWNENLNLIK